MGKKKKKDFLHTHQMILRSVQETLLPQQVSITTTGHIYFLSQSTTQRNQEGCSEPGEVMDIKKKKKRKNTLTTSPLAFTHIA